MSEPAAAPIPSAPAPVPPARPVPPSKYLQGLAAKEERRRASARRTGAAFAFIFAVLVMAAWRIGEVGERLAALVIYAQRFVAAKDVPGWLVTLVGLLLHAIGLLAVVNLSALFLVWWERKVSAHMQQRLGPMETGGWHGWLQTVADGIKLFLKETIRPEGADTWVYRFAPIAVFVPAYLSFAPLYFGKDLTAVDLDIGLLFVLAVSGLSSIGLLMGGWSSNNKFAILGGLRAAAQTVSFEIPRLLSLIPAVMWAGTLSLTGLVQAQAAPMWGWFPRWFVFYPVVGQIAFVIYLVTTIAETSRVPFDNPEAESELVAGFHTEYGGMKFAFFFLAEYAYVTVGSLLGAVVFLGGGAPPVPALGFVPSWAWLLGKALILMFVFLWVRWTMPRIRVDRVMDLCWKFFVPWALLNILIVGGALLWRMR